MHFVGAQMDLEVVCEWNYVFGNFFLNVSIVYDCGMYLICIAEALCKRLLDKDESTSLPVEVNAHTVKRKRSEIRQIIKDLQKTCPIQTKS